jgi:membrane-associated phospholipid phosphatase
MNWRGAKTSALLSLLFLVVYGVTNWLASLRTNVRSLPFGWERHVPFVPLMILPYMSIDAFFVAAPLLCVNAGQCRTLARRLGAAILVAGFCFLVMPLRFSFERPHVDGWLGAIFNNFRLMDRPFNQFPSLHVALGVILAVFYWERFRGLLRMVIMIWFVLVIASAVLTYQHHMIDVIGGGLLGLLCLHLFQEEPLWGQKLHRNPRVALYYLTAGILLIMGSILIGRAWGVFLLCPAISCGLIAFGYWGIGGRIYRKKNGQLPLTTKLLLWPVLLGQRASLGHYARQCRAWNSLTENLWIGRHLGNGEAQLAIDAGVRAVLDLTAEFSEADPFRKLPYRQLAILDLTEPTQEQLIEAVEWIQEKTSEGIVYLHCKAGYSRTAAVAGAYLLAVGKAADADGAMRLLTEARPSIVIRPEVAAAIRKFERTLLDRRAPAVSNP